MITKIETGKKHTNVYVDTVEEARAMLEAMDLRPHVNNKMPYPEVGHGHPLNKQPKGTYRGDLINTGGPGGSHPSERIHGFDKDHPHSQPHYNIVTHSGKRGAIIIGKPE